MKWSCLLLMLLGGCKAEADPLQRAIIDSLTNQDYRLIVRAGRGEVAPGVPIEKQDVAKARCGVRYLDGLGDVIKPGEDEAFNKLMTYAAQYNQHMIVHCLTLEAAKQEPPKLPPPFKPH